jgi:hypothetical protein
LLELLCCRDQLKILDLDPFTAQVMAKQCGSQTFVQSSDHQPRHRSPR